MRPRRSLAGVLFILPVLLVLLTSRSSTAPAAAPASEAAGADEPKESFTLAVVRRDSIAIPFATYDGKRWKNSWPKPESHVTAPIVMADVPKRWWSGREPIAKWTFWPIDPSDGSETGVAAAGSPAAAGTDATAAVSRPLETIGPTWYPAHCQQSLGLRTTYSSREVLPPPQIQPYPKAGLAVAGNAVITPIEIVDIASAAAAPLVNALGRKLVKQVLAEEKRVVNNWARSPDGWRHPYTEEERTKVPFRIEALYKVRRGLGDRDVYYYEGLKHYAVRNSDSSSSSSKSSDASRSVASTSAAPPSSASQNLQSGAAAPSSQLLQAAKPDVANGKGPGQAPCDLVTFVSGWLIAREDDLRRSPEDIEPLQVNVDVTSCDFAASYIMLPLGVVRVKDKALWAVQWSGWTHEHYAVIDVKEDLVATVLATDGGFCLKR